MWYSENIQKLYRYADSVMEKLTPTVFTRGVFTVVTASATDEGVVDTMGINVAVVVTAGA